MTRRTVGWFKEYWRNFTIGGRSWKFWSYRNWVWATRQRALDKLQMFKQSNKVRNYRITKEKFGYRLWIR